MRLAYWPMLIISFSCDESIIHVLNLDFCLFFTLDDAENSKGKYNQKTHNYHDYNQPWFRLHTTRCSTSRIVNTHLWVTTIKVTFFTVSAHFSIT
jgi:hypothetical protein